MIFLFGLFLLFMLSVYLKSSPSIGMVSRPPELEGVLRTQYKPIKSFQLVDHNNVIFNEAKFKGKWTFIFFGYMSCPDICPTTLSVLNAVQNLLDEQNIEKMQVLFISVDPGRDTNKLLASYVEFFNKNFIGATADKAEIDNVTRQFGAGYEIEAETAPGQYLVAHTSAIFLVDQFGRLVATFSQPHYSKTIASLYRKIRAYLLEEQEVRY